MPFANCSVVKVHAPVPVTSAVPNNVEASNTLTVLLASAVPVRVSICSLVTWSPTVPVSGENEAIAGVSGAVVSIMTFSALEAALVLPATVSVAVGRDTAEQRDAVIDRDGGIGFGAAGERQGVVIGDAIANRAAVGRVRGDARHHRCGGINGDGERTRGGAGVAGHIGGGCRQAVGAVGERCRGIGPVAAAIGGDTAEQRDPVIDLDGGIGFSAADQPY